MLSLQANSSPTDSAPLSDLQTVCPLVCSSLDAPLEHFSFSGKRPRLCALGLLCNVNQNARRVGVGVGGRFVSKAQSWPELKCWYRHSLSATACTQFNHLRFVTSVPKCVQTLQEIKCCVLTLLRYKVKKRIWSRNSPLRNITDAHRYSLHVMGPLRCWIMVIFQFPNSTISWINK